MEQAYSLRPGQRVRQKFARPLLATAGTKKESVVISRYEFKIHSGSYLVEYGVSLVKPTANSMPHFEDNVIDAIFVVSSAGILVALRNKLDEPVRIDWDQVSLVDTSGLSKRILHEGVRIAERDRPKSPPPSRLGVKLLTRSCRATASPSLEALGIFLRSCRTDQRRPVFLAKQWGCFFRSLFRGSRKTTCSPSRSML